MRGVELAAPPSVYSAATALYYGIYGSDANHWATLPGFVLFVLNGTILFRMVSSS